MAKTPYPYSMNRIYYPRSHPSKIDVADARDALRAQFPYRFRLTETHYLMRDLASEDSKSKSDYWRPLHTITARNLGEGAFMKGETLRGTDGRILRQGTGVGGQTIDVDHRHSRQIPGSGLDGIGATQRVKQQQGKVERNQEIASYTGLRNTPGIEEPTFSCAIPEPSTRLCPSAVTAVRMSGRGAEVSDSLDCDRHAYPVYMQEADEMFNLFINVDECDGI